ncbi:pollen-specific leucine-rich repeat extensin-like protein 1 [Salvia splendens]|uniref:pollen-specific leucine-rich repeat extensin-like protein 1 n=1 Tax=Salvia splendens TaxID=180675 RepID=UPI001C279ECF|nr:pollen-specific leucine-rich repeat extensin-like protein 1 [Salvia splendens]
MIALKWSLVALTTLILSSTHRLPTWCVSVRAKGPTPAPARGPASIPLGPSSVARPIESKSIVGVKAHTPVQVEGPIIVNSNPTLVGVPPPIQVRGPTPVRSSPTPLMFGTTPAGEPDPDRSGPTSVQTESSTPTPVQVEGPTLNRAGPTLVQAERPIPNLHGEPTPVRVEGPTPVRSTPTPRDH